MKLSKIQKKMSSNPWIISTTILVIIIAILLGNYSGVGVGITKISATNAGEKLLEFANNQGANAELVEVNDNGAFYEVVLLIQGQQMPLYVTKDGTSFTQSLISLDLEAAKQASTQAPTQDNTQNPEESEDSYSSFDPEAVSSFMDCLADKGVKIYGADWCGWTKSFVVETLGGFDVVSPIYVECTVNEEECAEAGISGYPTTQINGETYSGGRSFKGLSDATGCTLPA